MENVRVRLEFENGHILSNSQRSEGLNRSWLLLKPEQHQVISHLSSHLLQVFDLHLSCPNGILLSMEGFVLPPFESTCILKDKDVISVKKKGDTLSDIIGVGDGVNSVEEVEIVEKVHVHTGVPLLANEEFEKETGGYQSEAEEDEEDQSEDILPVEKNSLGNNAVSKKRKASKKLQRPKRKKKRHSVVPDGVENDVHTEHIEIYPNDLTKKSLGKKEKVSSVKSKPNVESTPEIAERSNSNVEHTPSVKRSDQLQENGQGIKDVSDVPEGNRKVPSRSARRKKAKRKWLREVAKIEKKDVVCHSKGLLHWKQDRSKTEKKEVVSHPKGLLHWKQERAKAGKKEVVSHPKGLLHWKKLPKKDVHKDMIEHEQPNQNSGAEDDVVPIVTRPGHIRFEPLGKDEAVQQSQVSAETFKWNGITSKKKGQKWGQENFSYVRRNEYKDLSKEKSEMSTIEKEIPVNDPINFDKLPPLPSLPKEDDMIAYRLIELSSSWTPELSSFRVGRISRYDRKSGRIILKPVSEYPIIHEHLAGDSSALQPDNSLYWEDGSLEVDFSSLIDIRVVKPCNSGPAKAASGRVNEAPPENGELNVWDRLIQRGSAW